MIPESDEVFPSDGSEFFAISHSALYIPSLPCILLDPVRLFHGIR